MPLGCHGGGLHLYEGSVDGVRLGGDCHGVGLHLGGAPISRTVETSAPVIPSYVRTTSSGITKTVLIMTEEGV